MAETSEGLDILEVFISRALDVHPNVPSKMRDDLQGDAIGRVKATSVEFPQRVVSDRGQ